MKKTKIPSPLITGAVIARRTITLGMGHEAIITITYDGPSEPAPSIGSQWPPERDWPAAKLRVSLPSHQYDKLHTDLVCAANVTGETMAKDCANWGEVNERTSAGEYRRIRTDRRSNASLRSLAAQFLRETQAELRPVQKHLADRAKRLAQRDATLQAGLDIAPLKS